MSKLISVIVPHYPTETRKQLLINNLKALLAQSISKSHYEIIVVIDGFANKLVEFLNDNFSEVTVLTKKQTGVCQTRNLGLIHSQAKYIAFIDDDCVPDKSWLKNYLDFITRTPDAFAIGGQTLSSSNKSKSSFGVPANLLNSSLTTRLNFRCRASFISLSSAGRLRVVLAKPSSA